MHIYHLVLDKAKTFSNEEKPILYHQHACQKAFWLGKEINVKSPTHATVADDNEIKMTIRTNILSKWDGMSNLFLHQPLHQELMSKCELSTKKAINIKDTRELLTKSAKLHSGVIIWQVDTENQDNWIHFKTIASRKIKVL